MLTCYMHRSHGSLVATALILGLCLSSSSPAAQPLVASAVDIRGKRHIESLEFPGLPGPWIRDRVAYIEPEYPHEDIAYRHQGAGLFRISIDPRTGLVTRIEVVISTGFPSLDRSAIAAIRRWRWKPQTWKQVDTPIQFTMGSRRLGSRSTRLSDFTMGR
jgi:TonB family protein